MTSHHWLSLLLCLSALGCSTISSGPPSPPSHLFTGPERQIRLVVLAPTPESKAVIESIVDQASISLFEQAGMSLVIVDWRSIEWTSGNRGLMLNQVAQEMRSYGKPYDIAVAFQDFGIPQLLQYLLVGTWEGVIDDTYRRFIIIRRMTAQVLLHEICHAFLFSHDHSWGLRHLMTPLTVYILPGIMPLNRSNYLSEKDRAEVLRNKWRDFSALPPLGLLSGEDRISQPAVND